MSLAKVVTALSVLLLLAGVRGETPLAAVKNVQGAVKQGSDGVEGAWVEVKPYALLEADTRLQTAGGARAGLRLIDEKASLDILMQSQILLKKNPEKAKGKGAGATLLILEKGRMTLSVPDSSLSPGVEGFATRVLRGRGKWSFSTLPEGSSLIVLEGWADVYNAPKDMQGRVRARQKGISDADGLRIVDASSEELQEAGFRQQILEIDFHDPQNEEFSTLEIEYESGF